MNKFPGVETVYAWDIDRGTWFFLALDFLVTAGAVVLRSTAVVRVAEQIYFVWA